MNLRENNMRIAEISTFSEYSVGKIMKDIKSYIDEHTSDVCKIFFARGESKYDDYIKFGNTIDVKLNGAMARIFDNDGFCFKKITIKLIEELKKFNPDIVHIHCLHGYYCNINVLFDYFKTNDKIKILWTMHDVWAITGHCCFFDRIKCQKWIKQCYNCEQKKEYPKSLIFDSSRRNYINKRKIFESLNNKQFIICTTSNWIENKLKKTFFSKYKMHTIYNGIDLTIFNNLLNIRKNNTYKLLLGVASVWDNRKGLDTFLEIAKTINEDWNILIIGKIRKNIQLPSNIKHINRTSDQAKLADFYREASVVFNPTLDDNYPTVNLEAQACGAKVLTFDTGGCCETDCGNLYFMSSNSSITEILSKIYLVDSLPINKINYAKLSKERMAEEYYELMKG